MATVITCPGAFTVYNTDNFGGTLFASPNTRIAGSWNNFTLTDSAATTDMNNLYTSIVAHKDDSGGVVVAGHSRGGQIVYKLLRQRLADLTANIDPTKILFISSGNPERKYGGASVNNYAEKTPVYPGTGGYGVGYGVPTGGIGSFKLLDIARQYDEWADYPNDFNNTTAMARIDGNGYHSAYDVAPHLGLDGYPVDWAEWTVHVEGNITYLTSPDDSLVSPPSKSFLARLFAGWFAQHRIRQTQYLDAVARSNIEVAYVRPVPVLVRVTG